MSYKYQIKVYGDENWYDNAVAFATEEEAEAAGLAKWTAWTLSEAYRVVESGEPVNYKWTEDGLKAVDHPQQEGES